jgi:hypothetical protein
MSLSAKSSYTTGLVKVPNSDEAVVVVDTDFVAVADDVDLDVVVAEDADLDVVAVLDRELPPVHEQVPGRHWEYQLLENVQQAPEIHVVGPVHP